MNTLKLICLFIFLVGNTFLVSAQNLRVIDITLATDIQEREPVGADSVFTADVGTIYCHSIIEGAADTTDIYHVWHYKDEEKARIPLRVASQKWRTWSSKSILKSWTGHWRVMIEDKEGNILATKSFAVK